MTDHDMPSFEELHKVEENVFHLVAKAISQAATREEFCCSCHSPAIFSGLLRVAADLAVSIKAVETPAEAEEHAGMAKNLLVKFMESYLENHTERGAGSGDPH